MSRLARVCTGTGASSRNGGAPLRAEGRKRLMPAVLALVMIAALQPLAAQAELTDELWGHWPFDNDFADASGNGRDLTGAGISIDLVNQKAGSGTARAEGAENSYLSRSGFPTGSTSVTFAAWFNRDNNACCLGYGVIGAGSTAGGGHLLMRAGASSSIRIGADLTSSSDNWHASATTFSAVTWIYLVVTYDHVSKEVRLYTDGTLDANFPVTLTDPLNLGSGDLRVCGDLYNDNELDGFIDEVGVWTRALSASEVTDLVNANGQVLTAGVTNDLWAYWAMDGDFTDSSVNGRDLSNVSPVIIQTADKQAGAGAAEFNDGRLVQSSGFPTGSTSVTYAAWFNIDNLCPGLGCGVIGAGSKTPHGSHFMVRAGASGTIRVGADLSSSSDNWHTSATTFSALTWIYLVVTYDHVSKDVRLYTDGTLDGNFPVTLTDPLNLGSGDLRIGGDAYNDNDHEGRIDEAAVWTRVLSAAEVTQLYNANGQITGPGPAGTVVIIK